VAINMYLHINPCHIRMQACGGENKKIKKKVE
jgi:hypothetical protein